MLESNASLFNASSSVFDSAKEEYPFGKMTVNGMLRNTFSLYKENFWKFFAISSVISLSLLPLSIWMLFAYYGLTPQQLINELINNISLKLMLLLLFGLIISYWAQGALILSISETIFNRPIKFRESFARTRTHIINLGWGSIFVTCRILFGLIFAIFPGILAALNNFLFQQCIVLENTGGSDGATRSRELVVHKTPNFPHPRYYILASFLVVLALSLFASVLVQFPTLIMAVGFKNIPQPALVSIPLQMSLKITQICLNVLIISLVLPIFFTANTLLYWDFRKKNPL